MADRCHGAIEFVWTFWLCHVMCAGCGRWLAVELDPEINSVANYGRVATRMQARTLTVDGVTRTLLDWSSLTGIMPDLMCWRMKHGWSPRDAVFRPFDQRTRNKEISNGR